MDNKYSSNESAEPRINNSRSREPLVYIVASDRDFMESVLAQCNDVPAPYTVYSNIEELMNALASLERLDLAFALVVEKAGDDVDALLLRTCKLEYPQLNYVMLLENCDQANFLRLQSMGVQNVILPPFADVDLRAEIATALPNVPQFKRHPDLMKRGRVRLDFLIPSDLSYVLGVNYLISMLLKEFSFSPSDCRINIPLACDEALTNAILHGNASSPEKKVSIQIYVSASRIKLRVKDQGAGFDVATVANPTKGKALMRSRGRGVYLMNNIMDSVEYKEGGRVVELEKINTNSNNNAPGNNKKS